MAGRQAGPSTKVKTLDAGADLSASSARYTFQKVSAAYAVTTAGAGERPVGVLEVGAAQDRGCGVSLIGSGGGTILKAGAAVTAGDPIKSDASGRGVTATSGNDYYAIALETVANADEYFEALLQTGRVA